MGNGYIVKNPATLEFLEEVDAVAYALDDLQIIYKWSRDPKKARIFESEDEARRLTDALYQILKVQEAEWII